MWHVRGKWQSRLSEWEGFWLGPSAQPALYWTAEQNLPQDDKYCNNQNRTLENKKVPEKSKIPERGHP